MAWVDTCGWLLTDSAGSLTDAAHFTADRIMIAEVREAALGLRQAGQKL